MDQSMDGWIDGGMDCGAFYEGDTDQSMGSVVIGGGGGGWKYVSAAIEFAAEYNGDWGGGYPVEGRESVCMR